MEVVAESVLSSALEVLFGKLASPDLLKLTSQEEVIGELEGWKRKLLMIDEVLDEAEEKQINKSSVKQWVEDLRDLAYDMEDVLDEFAAEQLRRSSMADRPFQTAITSKVRTRLIPTCFAGFDPVSQVKFNMEIRSKIKDITRRLDEISTRKADLGLKSLEKFASGAASTWSRPSSTSLITEPVHGRDDDKNAIIEMLLKDDEATESNLEVIPIVGLGGMGKTTLAQFIFRDDQIVNHFEPKAWVCVSDEHDAEKITKMIFNAVSPDEIRDGDDFNQVQLKLSKHLTGKRFLLVLDDVWRIKRYEQWNQLRTPLKSGKSGSKIVITTRDINVALLMRADNYHYLLRPLSDQDVWSVFLDHAFESKSRNVAEDQSLKSSGEKIVQKCGGLPLAAKLLGGLRRSKYQVEEWNRTLDSEIWSNNEFGIIPVLRLSYRHLPSHLKRCFAYCSLFPKGFEFEQKELILLWMAEGLIHQPKDDNRQMEDIGVDYFNELLSRCFFQPSSNHQKQFLMHDLVNDLAQEVATRICIQLKTVDDICHKIPRHLSFMSNQYDDFKKFEICDRMEKLRTFLVLPNNVNNEEKYYLSPMVVHNLVPKLRLLRVLSLSFYEINELPDSIGDLKHLRYLNLSCTTIRQLPETVSVLYNLQSLILRNCQKLIMLPTGIVNLTNLRHLDISGSTVLKDMPPKIGNLINLQTLPKFVVSKGGGSRIKELEKLLNLRGVIRILRLENIVDPGDLVHVNLRERPTIEKLVVEWSYDSESSRTVSSEMKVLEGLQPHQSLKKLVIAGYGGSIFPSWVGVPSYLNLVKLRLIYCKNITSLPSLGRLPLLKVLVIEGMNNIKSIGNEFCGGISKPFQSLEHMELKYMPEWRYWVVPESSEGSQGVFPCLRELEIVECPKLNSLPHQLSSLTMLRIKGCQELTISIPRFQSLTHLKVRRCKEGMFENGVVDMPSLNTLIIKNILKPRCLWEGLSQPLLGLEVLQISGCDELRGLKGLESLGGLRKLRITGCNQVVSLEEQRLPCNLEYMGISGCSNLERLPNALHNLTSLTELVIHDCPKLVSFPESGLPSMLRSLWVKSCEAVEALPAGMMMDNNALERLEVEGCPSLVGFPKGELPTTLTTLIVKQCEKLESLPEGIMHPTSHLEYLSVLDCPSLKSIPKGNFPPTLEYLSVMQCNELDSIPWKTLQNLTSLYLLSLYNCPDVMSSSLQSFIAPNLKFLIIANNHNHVRRPLSAGGLRDTFTSLEKIYIVGPFPDVISLTDDWFQLLPASLTLLCIAKFGNLKYISSIGLQTLGSLQTLVFWDCPKLRSFVPKEGLPLTLGSLLIWNCHFLKKRCRKDRGKDWPKIAHVPCVKIDDILQQ